MSYIEFNDELKKRYYKIRNQLKKALVEKGVFVSDFVLDDYAVLTILEQDGELFH